MSDLTYSGACYKPNSCVSSISYSCRQKSFFVIELGYFNASILMCYSFKKFKRVTVTVCLQARLLLFSFAFVSHDRRAGTSQCSLVLILWFALFY